MVGDGTYLSVKEALDRFAALGRPISDTTVRTWLKDGLLRGWYAGNRGYARIEPASIDELVPYLAIPPGPERDAALRAVRERNRLMRGEDPAGGG